MDVGILGPASEESALLTEGENLAAKARSGNTWKVACGIDQDEFVLSGPAEELA
jgi:hypothetical protein